MIVLLFERVCSFKSFLRLNWWNNIFLIAQDRFLIHLYSIQSSNFNLLIRLYLLSRIYSLSQFLISSFRLRDTQFIVALNPSSWTVLALIYYHSFWALLYILLFNLRVIVLIGGDRLEVVESSINILGISLSQRRYCAKMRGYYRIQVLWSNWALDSVSLSLYGVLPIRKGLNRACVIVKMTLPTLICHNHLFVFLMRVLVLLESWTPTACLATW